MLDTYLSVGLIIAIWLFVSIQIDKKYFTEILGFKSFYAIVTNEKIIISFIIIVCCWPLALVNLVYSQIK